MRIELDHDERNRILSIVRTWDRSQISQDSFRDIQKKCGVPARLVEVMFWHLDTLGVLQEADWLVFKGGTCVQGWLPAKLQRASVDLDLNSKAGNPNTVRAKMESVNAAISGSGWAIEVKGVPFGLFEPVGEDRRTGTLNYIRRMPSRFGELERVGDMEIQAKSIRVQINYKHSWLPALDPVSRAPAFFIQEYQRPKTIPRNLHSSPGDLLADKIIAASMVGPFGRERFKDAYDIGMLLRTKTSSGKVQEKLGLVAGRAQVDPGALVRGAVETISAFGERSLEARGFSSMVCRDGKEATADWEAFCYEAAGTLRERYLK